MAADPGDSHASSDLVVLGASNVTRSISSVVKTAQSSLSQPLQVLVAAGHGRSYGMESSVLGRRLPAILNSAVWEALDGSENPVRRALITDIGNDLIFGASPTTIANWVEQCVERLQRLEYEVVVTRLPLDSILSLSRTRFMLARTVLFPTSRLTYVEALKGSEELDALVQQLAKKRNAATVGAEREWYGVDPIHIRQSFILAAWRKFFSAFDQTRSDAQVARTRLSERWWLKFSCPHERKLFGVRQTRQQPALLLRSGSQVSFF